MAPFPTIGLSFVRLVFFDAPGDAGLAGLLGGAYQATPTFVEATGAAQSFGVHGSARIPTDDELRRALASISRVAPQEHRLDVLRPLLRHPRRIIQSVAPVPAGQVYAYSMELYSLVLCDAYRLMLFFDRATREFELYLAMYGDKYARVFAHGSSKSLCHALDYPTLTRHAFCVSRSRYDPAWHRPRSARGLEKWEAHRKKQQRLLREVKIAQDVRPAERNILGFCSTDDVRVHMISPLAKGDLLDFIEKWRFLSPAAWLERCLSVMRDLAGEVAHLHALGIVHCDIKPDNVLMDGPGHGERRLPVNAERPRLTDFDLSLRFGKRHPTTERPRIRSARGTPRFLDPSWYAEEPTFTSFAQLSAVDIYSLAGTFYALLTRRPPFRGWSEGVAFEGPRKKLADQGIWQFPRIAVARPSVHHPLWNLLSDMTRPVPEARPSALEVRERLADMIRSAFMPEQPLRRSTSFSVRLTP